jgi:hypothetical protein
MAKSKKPTKRSAQQDDLEFLLKHALPPGARAPRFARTLSSNACADLGRLGVTDAQVAKLERILPGIAYYTHTGPSLVAARKPLDGVVKATEKAEKAVRSLLNAPASDEARVESRGRFFQSLEKLFPSRCPPFRQEFGAAYDHDGLPEAKRLLDAIREVRACAKDALASMPRSQTRQAAHAYPIMLIHAALNVSAGKQIAPSTSAESQFRQIASICYHAAGAPNADPLRAIRNFVRKLHSERTRKPDDDESTTRKAQGRRRRGADRSVVR